VDAQLLPRQALVAAQPALLVSAVLPLALQRAALEPEVPPSCGWP